MEYPKLEDIKKLKKLLCLLKIYLKDCEKNNKFGEAFKKKNKVDKKKFIQYVEEKMKECNVNNHNKKYIINTTEKMLNFENVKDIDITKKKYSIVKKEIDDFLELHKEKNGIEKFNYFFNELNIILTKHVFNNHEKSQLIEYAFKQKKIDKQKFKKLSIKHGLEMLKQTIDLLNKYYK